MKHATLKSGIDLVCVFSGTGPEYQASQLVPSSPHKRAGIFFYGKVAKPDRRWQLDTIGGRTGNRLQEPSCLGCSVPCRFKSCPSCQFQHHSHKWGWCTIYTRRKPKWCRVRGESQSHQIHPKNLSKPVRNIGRVFKFRQHSINRVWPYTGEAHCLGLSKTVSFNEAGAATNFRTPAVCLWAGLTNPRRPQAVNARLMPEAEPRRGHKNNSSGGLPLFHWLDTSLTGIGSLGEGGGLDRYQLLHMNKN